MITIYDVAKYAGVSKSTVSLVLNKSPLVKEATRLKVTEAMRTLNYVPNTAVQAQAEAAISVSLGFGGHNAAIALRRCV